MKPQITPSNIKAFMEGNSKMLYDNIIGLPTYLKEQLEYRKSKCPDCLEAGACKYCGCSVPGKFYVKHSCNNGDRFPDLMDEEEWSNFKRSKDDNKL